MSSKKQIQNLQDRFLSEKIITKEEKGAIALGKRDQN